MPLPPANNVGNEVLATLVTLLKDLPPFSLSMSLAASSLGKSCIDKGREFLKWVLSSTSGVDLIAKSMALEILFLFALQEGIIIIFVTIVNDLSSV